MILLDGLRSAHALKLAGGAVVIQYDRGGLGEERLSIGGEGQAVM